VKRSEKIKMGETKVTIPGGPPCNKDSRSFRPSSLAEINLMRNYQPLVFRYTKRNGEPGECNIGCGNSLEDLVIICTLYTTGYCFLLGIFSLLLKGALDTDWTSTLLWSFFFFGILFVCLVGGAVWMGMRKLEQEKIKRKKAAEEAKKMIEIKH